MPFYENSNDEIMMFHISCDRDLFVGLNIFTEQIIKQMMGEKITLDEKKHSIDSIAKYVVLFHPKIKSHQYIINKYLPQMVECHLENHFKQSIYSVD